MQPMDEIYQQYAREVFGFLMSRTRDRDLSEELTQETFYQAIRSVDKYDESCSVSTWLCAIAKNVLLTYRRKHPATEEMGETGETGTSAESQALGNLGRLDLIARVHALEEPGREVVYLRIFGDLSFAEIGRVLGRSENWARVTFYRAKEKLRKDVSDE